MKKGSKHTEETLKKISQSLIGRVSPRGMLGKKMSDETRKKMSVQRTGLKKKPFSEEAKKRMSDGQKGKKYASGVKRASGEKHWNWKKDRNLVIKRDIRNDPAYKAWRSEVYKRDNYCCKINNNECSGRIESHHILSWKNHPELRYEVSNGITLCHFHHPFKRTDEETMSPYFQQLITITS